MSLPKKLADKWIANFAHRIRSSVDSCKDLASEPLIGHLPLALAILVSIVASSLLVVITVLPWINPTNRLVSVDAPVYYQWLDHMRSLDVNFALSFAAINDRAVFLVLSYFLSFVVSPVTIMQFIPALLVPLFCVASLFMVKLVCNFRETWIYAVLIAPLSITALGLVYSGYFANMLAVILSMCICSLPKDTPRPLTLGYTCLAGGISSDSVFAFLDMVCVCVFTWCVPVFRVANSCPRT